MKSIFLSVVFAASCAYAQLNQPSLERLKIAADAGDPAAQDKLAERLMGRIEIALAEVWYRKSAEQGYAHAQGQLGNLLLMHYGSSVGKKPEARAVLGNEALKWVILAANQGDIQGQANFAQICLDGKLVKQDFIEAYKWGDLAAKGGEFNFAAKLGRSARDTAILKMNADQIAEAKRRVAFFAPHEPLKSELPVPVWVQKIKLNGISGTTKHRLAVIDGHTFEEGDGAKLKVDGKTVQLKCLLITDSSVTVSIGGIEGNRTLVLN